MDFTIHFRGVALFAMRADRSVSEVLFPNAESVLPVHEDWDGPATPQPTNPVPMLHADGAPAIRHFARALVPGPSGPGVHHNIHGCTVRRRNPPSDHTPAAIGFEDELPNVARAIAPDHRLQRRTTSALVKANRISTIIRLDGGAIVPAAPVGGFWEFSGDQTAGDPVAYQIEATWVIPMTADELVLDVTRFDGSGSPNPIVLDASNREAYLYNFEIEEATKYQLEEQRPGTPGMIDHDFKWLYGLLKPADPQFTSWGRWIGGFKVFPAPMLSHTVVLPSVSTCFPTVWQDE